MKCKYCGSERLVKSGLVAAKQRYICKDCSRTSRDGDHREKYSIEKRFCAIKMHLEGARVVDIEKVEEVSNSLIIHWLRNADNIIRNKILSVEVPENLKGIEVINIDDVKNYLAKKYENYNSALLIIGTDVQLLSWEKNGKK